jgi:hypothetical protein
MLTTLLFFCLGLMRRESRTYLAFNCIVYLIFGGMANGYFTARAMKFFGAEEWRFAASAGSLGLPLFIGVTFILVDLIDWFEKSDQALPISSIFLYTFLWGCLNVPAVYFASYLGFMHSNDQPPCKVSLVRKAVPEQPFYLKLSFMAPMASLLMFSTVMLEFHYVITSVWRSYVMVMFVFMFLNVNLLLIVISVISILCTYFQL